MNNLPDIDNSKVIPSLPVLIREDKIHPKKREIPSYTQGGRSIDAGRNPVMIIFEEALAIGDPFIIHYRQSILKFPFNAK